MQPRKLRIPTDGTKAAAAPSADRPRFAYVSSNADKCAEAVAIGRALGMDIECVAPGASSVPEIQGDAAEIARSKCIAAYAGSDRTMPVVVEDVALHLDALGGLPGPYVRDFLKGRSLDQIHALAAPTGRSGVEAVSAVAYTDDGVEVHVFVGHMKGRLRDPAAFVDRLPAWYPLVECTDRDEADVDLKDIGDDKMPYLHRARAFASLAQFLAERPSKSLPSEGRPISALVRSQMPITTEATERMAAATRVMLECIGEDPDREGLLDTPDRVAKAMAQLTVGYRTPLSEAIGDALFEHNDDDMVVVRDVPFHSLCEHHMLPFMGRAHVGYVPAGKVIGLSKVPRIVDMFSKRLQVQERLTSEIARCIVDATGAPGAGVIIEAQHMCMRGVGKSGSTTTTATFLGTVRDDPAVRAHFMDLVRGALGGRT